MQVNKLFIFTGVLFFLLSACTSKHRVGDVSALDTLPAPLREFNLKISQNQKDLTAYLSRAQWFIKNARYSEALNDIRSVIIKDSLNPAAFVILGDAYLNLGQPLLAEKAYTKALKIQPDFNDALLGLARYFLVLKNHDQTLSLTAKAIIKQSFNPTAYYLAAWSFMEKGDTLSALKNYLKAVEQKPDFFDAHVQLGILYGKKQPRMAEAFFKNALRINPRHVHTRYLLGLLYQQQGEIDKAITAHLDNLAINPEYVPSLFAMGFIQMADRFDFKEAINWYNKILIIDAKNASAYLNRGFCYEQLGNLKEAAADFRQALTIDPTLDKAAQGLSRVAEHN